MKSVNIVLGLVASSVLFLSSCNKDSMCVKGNGDIETRNLNLVSFTEIDLQESANVRIHQGNEYDVVVSGHSNIIDILETDISGDRWEIEFNKNCAKDYDLTIDITIPIIKEVVLSGAGNVWIDDFEANNQLELKVSGSGDIEMNSFSSLESFRALISGSGNITAYKSIPAVGNSDLHISGSGNIRTFNLISQNTDVLISGSGNIETTSQSSLDVRISGSGNVFYKGYPGINTDISGSGNLYNSN